MTKYLALSIKLSPSVNLVCDKVKTSIKTCTEKCALQNKANKMPVILKENIYVINKMFISFQ